MINSETPNIIILLIENNNEEIECFNVKKDASKTIINNNKRR